MPNLKMIRVQSKLDELFNNKIDLADASDDEERKNKYYTRAIAALAIIMRCGIDYDSAAQTITDGYHDMGIDAVYNDTSQKKLFLVPPRPIELGKPKIFVASCGNKATRPKNTAPTVDNLIKILDTYFCVSFPGQTLGI